ncbi:DUF4367 domain-containing protein [Methanococcoides methylutens]|uniref:DUF4367 domain-containing protein n=1 Tax=Methanococcoides methylutens MM1 TaxID=1434104 RepID=A0A0E3WZB0_METMT|nr:DUF4367 domain-containing protein [Methanococcoides methylutens]AKB84914.1 hypothetical protein MCMEM_0861 [Methanococcoides methylutens MM1]
MTRIKNILVLLLLCSAFFSMGCVDEQFPEEEIAEQVQQKLDDFEKQKNDEFESSDGLIQVTDQDDDIPIPEELTLDEAKDIVGFEILLPSYIPEGYEFDHALVYSNGATSEDNIYETVTLVYKNGADWLHISQVFSGTEFSGMLPEGDVETVSINGSEGQFLALLETNILQWTTNDLELSITGKIDKDELVNMAESMA